MAKRKSPQNNRVKFGEYRNERVDFNDAEKTEINSWIEAGKADLSSALLGALDQGWTVRLSYSDYYAAYQFTLTQSLRSHTYGGLCFILNHPDLTKLEQVFAYFFLHMVEPEIYRSRQSLASDNW